MHEEKKEYWFPAKKYGIGWGFPVTWQGWVVLAAYLVLVTLGSIILPTTPARTILFVIFMLTLSGLLIFICLKKGEKTHCRWGDK